MNNNKQKQNHLDTAPPCLADIGDGKCTGCAACANSCRLSAIGIKLNREGFYRPVLHKELCGNCMACLLNCPVIAADEGARLDNKSTAQPETYAAWSNDEEIHFTSSSGGIFSELARLVLENSGAVCGCEWGDNWRPRHVLAYCWDEISRLRGSKYIPSLIGPGFYREIIALAASGVTVLFCGTPCQVAGLDLICPAEARKNLILVDLVCHGVPSLASFWRYLDWKFGSPDNITYFSFRDKELSLKKQGAFFYSISATTGSGEKYLVPAGQDPWFKSGMMYHLFLQRSCYECRFGALTRHGDITLGDFWGIPDDWHDPHGDSVLLANTEKGKGVMRQLIRCGRIRAKSSEYSTAASRSGRLRGLSYPAPIFRALSLKLIAGGKSFGWVYVLIYLPLRFREQIIAYARKTVRLIFKPFKQLSGLC